MSYISDNYDGPQMARRIIRLQAEVAALRADAERMKLELSRWICVWCNHITLATGDPDTDYAALQAHTLSCKDNPLVQAQAEVAALRKRCDWMLHNGGTWCDEWPKEWVPGIHGPLIPWLSKRIDAALKRNK